MAQHKWHKEITHFVEGNDIEWKLINGEDEWEHVVRGFDLRYFDNPDYKFRIKPQPKEPQYLYAYYLEGQGEAYLYNRKQELEAGIDYIGKIKLEQEDE